MTNYSTMLLKMSIHEIAALTGSKLLLSDDEDSVDMSKWENYCQSFSGTVPLMKSSEQLKETFLGISADITEVDPLTENITVACLCAKQQPTTTAHMFYTCMAHCWSMGQVIKFNTNEMWRIVDYLNVAENAKEAYRLMVADPGKYFTVLEQEELNKTPSLYDTCSSILKDYGLDSVLNYLANLLNDSIDDWEAVYALAVEERGEEVFTIA